MPDVYLLQLPYLDSAGNPLVIEVDENAASALLQANTHRKMVVSERLFCLTPCQRACTDIEFQIGGTRY